MGLIKASTSTSGAPGLDHQATTICPADTALHLTALRNDHMALEP